MSVNCALERFWEDPPEEDMAIHSGILAWRILWTEEPDRLQFMGLERVRHNLATKEPKTIARNMKRACGAQANFPLWSILFPQGSSQWSI